MKCANAAKAHSVFSSALRRIKPGREEGLRDFQAAEALMERLRAAVPPCVEIRLAGSLAKGTNLAGKNEFDVFLLFPRHYPLHEMTMLGLSYARRAFSQMRHEVRYAEHPYMQVFSGSYRADVVPAYKISHISEKGSSVDRSQLHTEYVNSKLDSRGKDEVRLLKAFMRNFGIYGAELRVEGFSGYLCELLIIHHGSLLKLMEEASEWREPAMDLEMRGGSREKMRAEFGTPLVVIDPVDPKRNVAAVVAQTSLSRFIFECRRFLASPSGRFFFREKTPRSASQLRRMMGGRGTSCLAVRFPAPNVVPDVLWPQLKKTAQAVVRRLASLDFSVFGCYHWSDGKECVVLFELDRWQLPPVRKVSGPSVAFARDVDAFVKKHAQSLNLHIEHDRIVAVEKRAEVDAKRALSRACKNTGGLGIPHHMEKALSRACVIDARLLLRKGYLEFLSDYFFMKIA